MKWVVLFVLMLLPVQTAIAFECQSSQERAYWMQEGAYWKQQALEGRAELESVKDEMQKLRDDLKSGDVDIGTFTDLYAKYEETRDRIESKVADADAHAREAKQKFDEADDWGERAEMIFWALLGAFGGGGGAMAHTRYKRGPSSKTRKEKLHDLADRLDEIVE
jgi:septal ring factor EnvC (AmiA/AmiB activator)